MLDKLPLELLDHVLDLLPPPSTVKSARERADTLLACCLVSKRVSERSMPVLWRHLRLQTTKSFEDFAARVAGQAAVPLRHAPKSLRMECEKEDEDETIQPLLARVFNVLGSLPALRDLYLDIGGEEVDLKALQQAVPSTSLPSNAENKLKSTNPKQISLYSTFPAPLSLLATHPSPFRTSLLSLYNTSPSLRLPPGTFSSPKPYPPCAILPSRQRAILATPRSVGG
jgi:hypothetical protein